MRDFPGPLVKTPPSNTGPQVGSVPHKQTRVRQSLSRVQLSATPWTVAHQAPLAMGFPRQECCSGLPFLSPGALANPGIEPASPVSPKLQIDSLPALSSGKGFPDGSDSKESACNEGDPGWTLGWEDPLEKGKSTLCSILAWRIPRTEEPGGVHSMGSQRVGPHD